MLVLSIIRLTRLVTTDEIGQWWIKDPIDRAAEQWYSEQTEALHNLSGEIVREPEQPWWWKYRSGLDCPHCVSFWAALLVLATRKVPGHRLVTAALATSYVVGHVSARLDGSTLDSDEDEEHT